MATWNRCTLTITTFIFLTCEVFAKSTEPNFPSDFSGKIARKWLIVNSTVQIPVSITERKKSHVSHPVKSLNVNEPKASFFFYLLDYVTRTEMFQIRNHKKDTDTFKFTKVEQIFKIIIFSMNLDETKNM